MKYFASRKLIVAILILFTFFSCKKKEVQTIYISDFLKEYTVFPLGSYWIFKNDTSTIIDSCYLLKSPTFSFKQYGADEPTYENCNIAYGGPFLTKAIIEKGRYYIGFKNTMFPNTGNFNNCLMDVPFQTGLTFNTDQYWEKLKYVSHFDTLQVNNTTFYDVICTRYSIFYHYFGFSAYFYYYFAKSIGVIKITWYNPQGPPSTWNLIRYYIAN